MEGKAQTSIIQISQKVSVENMRCGNALGHLTTRCKYPQRIVEDREASHKGYNIFRQRVMEKVITHCDFLHCSINKSENRTSATRC